MRIFVVSPDRLGCSRLNRARMSPPLISAGHCMRPATASEMADCRSSIIASRAT
jgi:hypothetical protein